jgi:hypothetical protein
MPDTGYSWKQLNKLKHWTHVFPLVTFFGIVSAIEGKIFKMLGIVNFAAKQRSRILIWVFIVFLIAVENVRVYVKLVT